MSGVVYGYRWALLGAPESISLASIGISSVIALIVFISGLFFFRRMERVFADMI
jgi:lipopolysaccharide transport system permease protein